MKQWPNTLMKSPYLFVICVGITLLCLLTRRHYQAKLEPPEIPGYSWRQHSNTLLICYLPDCGCGISAAQWSAEGISRGMDILLVSDKPMDKEVTDLKHLYPYRNIVVRRINSQLVRQLAPFGKTTATIVRQGRIIHQISGGFDFKKFAL